MNDMLDSSSAQEMGNRCEGLLDEIVKKAAATRCAEWLHRVI